MSTSSTRMVSLALLAVLVGIVLAATASAGPPDCSHGASSVGPAVIVNGHLARDRSDLKPHTETCLPGAGTTR